MVIDNSYKINRMLFQALKTKQFVIIGYVVSLCDK